MTLLETADLSKDFGKFTAIDEVSMTVKRGETRGIIGPNGAGKTTLFNLLSGVLPPTRGSIIYEGEDITTLAPHDRTKRGMSRSFQITSLFDDLTVRENVALAVRSRYFGSSPSLSMLAEPEGVNDDIQEVLEYFDIVDLAEQTVEKLSHGQKRKIELSLTMATGAELLMLDEPSAGLSPEATQRLVDVLERVAADYTVILVEHEVDLLMDLADRVTVLHQGKILTEDNPEAIRTDAEVQRVYLEG